MHKILIKIILISAMVCSFVITPVYADEQQQIKQLLSLHALAYRLLGEVSFYSLQQGGGQTEQRLDRVIQLGNELIQGMAQPNSLAKPWQEVVFFIEEHKSVAAAMSDINFITDLERHHRPLLNAIATAQTQYDDATVANYKTQRAQLALEHMIAEYMYFNINVFGGHAVTGTEIQNNNRLLKSLFKELPITEDQKNDLQRKWSFIERTVLNYNKTSAHFIVMRTADSVREGLQ